MNTYEVYYWTSPTSFKGGETKIEHITAKNRFDAGYIAKQKHPTWAVEQVTLYSTPYDDWETAAAER